MRFFLLTILIMLPLITGAQDLPSDDSFLFDEPEAHPEVTAKAVEILGPRYQTDLPEKKEVPVVNLARGALPDIFSKIVLVLGATIILILLFNMFYSSGRFDPGEDDEGDISAGDFDFSRLKIPDPELLAADGRFAEAIHSLLLRSLVLISQRLDLAWPRSLTSREILRHGQLPSPARSHLRQLIQRVEIHHFGGLEPAAADFARCQEIYSELAAGLKGGGL